MKISRISPKEVGAFGRYLPTWLPEVPDMARVYLAFHEKDLALGAAIADVGAESLDIVSLQYDNSVPQGTCEAALMDFLTDSLDQTTIEEITMVRQGTEEELAQLDDRMLSLGFFAIPTDSATQEATLETVVESQGFRQLCRLRSDTDIQMLDRMLLFLVRQYNTSHPAARIKKGQYDPLTSVAYQENDRLKALLLTTKREGLVSIDWLYSESSRPEVVAMLVRRAIQEGQRAYSPDTKLVLACEIGSVRSLAERLGFTCRPNQATHLYKQYLT